MFDEDGRPKGGFFVTLGVLVVAALVAIFVFQASKPEPLKAPTAFAPFVASDKSFACESPVGWKSASAAEHAVTQGVLFKNGSAKIDITADLAGSLMGDIAAAGNNMAGMGGMVPGMPGAPPPKPPVETVHEMAQRSMAKNLAEFEPTPMKPLQSSIGEARYSEYTAKGGLLEGKIRGYHITILGGERRVNVICQCPERDWKTLKPAFSRVVQSLRAGPG